MSIAPLSRADPSCRPISECRKSRHCPTPFAELRSKRANTKTSLSDLGLVCILIRSLKVSRFSWILWCWIKLYQINSCFIYWMRSFRGMHPRYFVTHCLSHRGRRLGTLFIPASGWERPKRCIVPLFWRLFRICLLWIFSIVFFLFWRIFESTRLCAPCSLQTILRISVQICIQTNLAFVWVATGSSKPLRYTSHSTSQFGLLVKSP